MPLNMGSYYIQPDPEDCILCLKDADSCDCPDCPVCGYCGDPNCVSTHNHVPGVGRWVREELQAGYYVMFVSALIERMRVANDAYNGLRYATREIEFHPSVRVEIVDRQTGNVVWWTLDTDLGAWNLTPN